jgi:GTPase SAR1 family protein
MVKNVPILGNPSSGKTTLLIALIHKLQLNGWIKSRVKDLPKEYPMWIARLMAGEEIPTTTEFREVRLRLNSFTYKGSKVNLGWGGINLSVRDMKGDDYRRRTNVFRDAVKEASAVLFTVDCTKDTILGRAISGQVEPLLEGLRYICEFEHEVKYIGLVFTKRALHSFPIEQIRPFVTEQFAVMLSFVRDARIRFGMFEVESRGRTNELKPWGIEPVIYDCFSTIGKLKGKRLDVTLGPDADWAENQRLIDNGTANPR